MSCETYQETILTLEKEIAYFFGLKNADKVAHHYIEAIKLLEERHKFNEHEFKSAMLAHLRAAYTEVKRQTSWDFDVHKAASWEFELFIANLEKASFEHEYTLLVNIYHEVFGVTNHETQNAALLRTFLYRYKAHLMSSERPLSEDDCAFLKSLASKTEIALRALPQLSSDSTTRHSSTSVINQIIAT